MTDLQQEFSSFFNRRYHFMSLFSRNAPQNDCSMISVIRDSLGKKPLTPVSKAGHEPIFGSRLLNDGICVVCKKKCQPVDGDANSANDKTSSIEYCLNMLLHEINDSKRYLTCPRCRLPTYCSRNCKRRDFNKHKEGCQAVVKARVKLDSWGTQIDKTYIDNPQLGISGGKGKPSIHYDTRGAVGIDMEALASVLNKEADRLRSKKAGRVFAKSLINMIYWGRPTVLCDKLPYKLIELGDYVSAYGLLRWWFLWQSRMPYRIVEKTLVMVTLPFVGDPGEDLLLRKAPGRPRDDGTIMVALLMVKLGYLAYMLERVIRQFTAFTRALDSHSQGSAQQRLSRDPLVMTTINEILLEDSGHQLVHIHKIMEAIIKMDDKFFPAILDPKSPLPTRLLRQFRMSSQHFRSSSFAVEMIQVHFSENSSLPSFAPNAPAARPPRNGA